MRDAVDVFATSAKATSEGSDEADNDSAGTCLTACDHRMCNVSSPAYARICRLLEFSRPGVRILLAHPSGLTCECQVASARVPDKFTVPLAYDNVSGTMEAIKTERIEGTVVLADNRAGKVTFDLPLARRSNATR